MSHFFSAFRATVTKWPTRFPSEPRKRRFSCGAGQVVTSMGKYCNYGRSKATSGFRRTNRLRRPIGS
jgi:hypothetical protein